MFKPSQFLWSALALSACGVAAAAPAPADITPMVYEASANEMAPGLLATTCPINIVGISDQRLSKESIGAETPIATDAPDAWVNSGLDHLKAYGYTVQHSDKPVENAINLDVQLIRAYTWFGNMRINGMVAFDVQLSSPSGRHTEKFRAAGSKTNMWGAKTEHVTALNYAFNSILHKMAQSLQSECAQAKLAMR